MAVSAVWRLINVLAFIEPNQDAYAHRREACAPLQKSKIKLLLVLGKFCQLIHCAHPLGLPSAVLRVVTRSCPITVRGLWRGIGRRFSTS